MTEVGHYAKVTVVRRDGDQALVASHTLPRVERTVSVTRLVELR